MPLHKDAYFKTHDQHRLYYQSDHSAQSKVILVLVHGLNEHIGRYGHVVDFFKKDFTVYLFDHRGHGRSDGVRSHVEHFDDYVNDLDAFIRLAAAEEKNQKIFLIGHSMGGQVVLNYVGKKKNPAVCGFITSSANVRMKVKVSAFKKFLANTLSQHAPRLKLPNEIDPKWISRDRNVVLAYKKDPLVGRSISVSLARELLSNQQGLMALAPKIRIPALMMHGGDDQICDSEGSRDFFDSLGSKDKEIKIYDGMYHEIFNEIGKEKVLRDVREWLRKRA